MSNVGPDTPDEVIDQPVEYGGVNPYADVEDNPVQDDEA